MAEPFVNLPMPNESARKFATPASFRKWLKETEEHWRWLTEGSVRSPSCVAAATKTIRAFLNECRTAAEVAELEGRRAQPEVYRIALQHFPNGVPLAADDEAMMAVQKHFAPYGDTAMAIATSAAIYMESGAVRSPQPSPTVDLSHPYALQAIGYAAIARQDPRPAQSKVLRGAIEDTAALRDQIRAEGEAQQTVVTEELHSMLARHAELVAAQSNAIRSECSRAIEEISLTKATFEELMRLKAPTDYWASKADEHKSNARTYRRWLTGLSIGAVLILGAVYGLGWLALDIFARNNPQGSIAMTFYVGGFVGAVTAVILWFIRIVVRLYMSQHHLAADGEERASMIRTYLALTEAGKVNEDERALVLASVFRPVPDGIVKDDGAPAYSPAGLIANLLDKRP